MTKVALVLVLTLSGQKPTNLSLDMPSIEVCLQEAADYLNFKQPEDKPKVLFQGAACTVTSVDIPGLDAAQ